MNLGRSILGAAALATLLLVASSVRSAEDAGGTLDHAALASQYQAEAKEAKAEAKAQAAQAKAEAEAQARAEAEAEDAAEAAEAEESGAARPEDTPRDKSA